MKTLRRRRTGRRGAAVVETAVMAPILLGMMLGMTELGSAFLVRQTVTNAAREGARAASLPGANIADVQSAVQRTMSAANLSGYTVQSNISSLPPGADEVWVSVSIPLNRATFTGNLFGSGTINIHGKSSMRIEGSSSSGSGQGIDP